MINAENWVDLPVGAEATLCGTLDMVTATGLVIRLPDWSRLLVDSDDAAGFAPVLGQPVELTVIRTEDGLFTKAGE